MQRTHTCGALRASDVGSTVTLTGWVATHRDLGGFRFVDLRDRFGVTQVKFDPADDAALFDASGELRPEWVIAVTGTVVSRGNNANRDMATGDVEVAVTGLEVLNRSVVPKFPIRDELDASEELRLEYRFLDLRRRPIQDRIVKRAEATFSARRLLHEEGFLELETPFLTRSTPEGARDYLVPSRVHPGEFYALPQSPQLFKQLYMVSGYDRYYQIARCFRDEDLRADRQPEFTQIDIEMSFADESAVQALAERLMVRVFADVLDVAIEAPFPRMAWREAMDRFGSDKPDVRFGLELCDVADLVEATEFGVFRSVVAGGGAVRGLRVPGGADRSRKQIDALEAVAKRHGAKGLAWAKVDGEAWTGPIAKFFPDGTRDSFASRMGAESGDLLLFVAADEEQALNALGQVRLALGRDLGLVDASRWAFLWVTDFPLLERDEDEGRWVARHHPFTSPVAEDVPLLESDPGRARARAYDLVLNGFELGGGSVRIHDMGVQEQMFRHLGIGQAEAEEKFGFLLRALHHGAPPHAGIAFGLDRLIMLMTGATSLRDVIAFPKTASASCLLTAAPSPVDDRQLETLHLARAGAAQRED
ncbi:MAG: aspartate--tRNA ligase [Deltaproteobacteria bacterium]|nr:MAG: aspartate--tRNA ligase [Deltaproteobacteria bacterium]